MLHLLLRCLPPFLAARRIQPRPFSHRQRGYALAFCVCLSRTELSCRLRSKQAV